MSYRLSKIYTRKGDDGTTSLDAKQRLLKNHLRIEVIGTLDELNSAIGLVLSCDVSLKDVKKVLTQVQHDLFNLGGELCPPYRVVMSEDKITALENQIDTWNEILPPLTEFILPGGNVASATCHLARAICRRAERCLVALLQEETVNADVLKYLNRLSDLLFVAARILSRETTKEELLWDHQRR